MTRIDYEFADGSFQRIKLKRLPESTVKVLVKWEQKERHQIKRDSRFLHGGGYVEGDSETAMREVNYSDPVADAADRGMLEQAVRDAVDSLAPAQQRRIWLYAQGYTNVEIAVLEGISEMAIRKSIKLAKKKIKKVLENGFDLASLF